MFCRVHTEKWSADTGYFDDDNEKEIEELNEALEKLIAPEVRPLWKNPQKWGSFFNQRC